MSRDRTKHRMRGPRVGRVLLANAIDQGVESCHCVRSAAAAREPSAAPRGSRAPRAVQSDDCDRRGLPRRPLPPGATVPHRIASAGRGRTSCCMAVRADRPGPGRLPAGPPAGRGPRGRSGPLGRRRRHRHRSVAPPRPRARDRLGSSRAGAGRRGDRRVAVHGRGTGTLPLFLTGSTDQRVARAEVGSAATIRRPPPQLHPQSRGRR